MAPLQRRETRIPAVEDRDAQSAELGSWLRCGAKRDMMEGDEIKESTDKELGKFIPSRSEVKL